MVGNRDGLRCRLRFPRVLRRLDDGTVSSRSFMLGGGLRWKMMTGTSSRRYALSQANAGGPTGLLTHCAGESRVRVQRQ